MSEGSPIDATGTITREAYPSATYAGGRSATHPEEVVYVLNLDEDVEVCTQGPRPAPPGTVERVRRFQLFRSPDLLLPQVPVVFARAHAQGRLTVGLTGPYHTPAAIEVLQFQTLGDWAPPAAVIRAAVVAYLPVTIAFKHALLGGPGFIEITNHASRPLAVLAEISARSGDHTGRWSTTIAPSATWRIGVSDGWTTAAGDRLLLRNPAFADVAAVVP
ncbi:MAG: hypothetical protein JSR54_07305 [Proteobacteria bacterium]|nr:hypothetical protein [Pseudomonadota bacterium]